MSERMRPSSPQDRLALKAAVRRAAVFGGGAASVQYATRVDESDLSRYSNPAYPERHCPLDVALDLDLEAGQPVILSAFAAAQKFRLVPEQRGAAGSLGPHDVAKLCTEHADLMRSIAAALDDSTINSAEAREIHREIEELMAVLRDLQGRVPHFPGRVESLPAGNSS
jgi:hypothetical protein